MSSLMSLMQSAPVASVKGASSSSAKVDNDGDHDNGAPDAASSAKAAANQMMGATLDISA